MLKLVSATKFRSGSLDSFTDQANVSKKNLAPLPRQTDSSLLRGRLRTGLEHCKRRRSCTKRQADKIAQTIEIIGIGIGIDIDIPINNRHNHPKLSKVSPDPVNHKLLWLALTLCNQFN